MTVLDWTSAACTAAGALTLTAMAAALVVIRYFDRSH